MLDHLKGRVFNASLLRFSSLPFTYPSLVFETLAAAHLDIRNMKFTSVIALVATAATLVGAVPFETNAERLARGLPPLPPARRASGVDGRFSSTLLDTI